MNEGHIALMAMNVKVDMILTLLLHIFWNKHDGALDYPKIFVKIKSFAQMWSLSLEFSILFEPIVNYFHGTKSEQNTSDTLPGSDNIYA